MEYIPAFITAFLISYILIPFLVKLAFKLDFVDKPTERKKHSELVPLLGGAGIFIGFLIGYIIFVHTFNKEFFSIITGGFLIFSIGLLDDWHKTKGREFAVLPRLLVQIAAAFIVYRAGIVFYGFTNPFTHSYIILPGYLQFILSITWILGVTTVINWCDGMDGLAGSLSSISASTLFVAAMVKGQSDSAVMAILLVGATLGFLKYNRHPAKIFMGDSGANFLGFILGVIALDGAFKQATLISMFIPILALGVPIFDNLFVIFKRFVQKKPIYKADRSQLHYRLQSMGFSTKQVVLYITLISVCLNLFSILLLFLSA